MYKIDLGYDFIEDTNRILLFENFEEAQKLANEILRETGEVLAITKEE